MNAAEIFAIEPARVKDQARAARVVARIASRRLASTKTILVLANSVRKHPGRCIAGREVVVREHGLKVGDWIRPVSAAGESVEGELLPDRHCALAGGGMPRVLDVVEVPLAGVAPGPGQPENWLVESGVPWRWLRRIEARHLVRIAESPADLWHEEEETSDRISERTLAGRPPRPSLVLIQPKHLRVRVWVEHNPYRDRPQRKVRGIFTYRDREHDLAITDDAFNEQHCHGETGPLREFTPPHGDDCVLCVSLGSPFHGYHHKLVATVIPLQ